MGFTPSVTVVVEDREKRILLVERVDNRKWALPGGVVDLGERVADTATREVFEETGLEVRLTGLVGIYTDPGHIIRYANGTTLQEFSVCFRAAPIAGALKPDLSEIHSVDWFTPAHQFRLSMDMSMRRRIVDAIACYSSPRIR